MKHSHSMRNYAKAFFAFTTLFVAGACADNNSNAPTAEVPTITAPANYTMIGSSVIRISSASRISLIRSGSFAADCA